MYQKIIVPLDGSELAECVLPHAEAIANGCGVKEVVFIRVAEPSILPSGALTDGGAVFTEIDADQIREKINASKESSAKDYLDQVAGRVKLAGAVRLFLPDLCDVLGRGDVGRCARPLIVHRHGHDRRLRLLRSLARTHGKPVAAGRHEPGVAVMVVGFGARPDLNDRQTSPPSTNCHCPA